MRRLLVLLALALLVAPACAVAPVADFTANITSGTEPLTVFFTDTSTGTPTEWAWDFDNDGDTDSTSQNAICEFANASTYSVSLTVTNGDGTDTETKIDYITVTEAAGAEADPVSLINLTETHGATWIKWSWTVTSLGADESLIARLDGVQVLNQTADSTPPLVTSWTASDLQPNERHELEVILLNSSSGSPVVTDSATLAATTGQSESFPLVLIALAFGLTAIAALARPGVMNLVFALTGLLLGAYVAVAAGTNVALAGMGLLVGVINGIVMVVNGMPLWKEWKGWSDDDDEF